MSYPGSPPPPPWTNITGISRTVMKDNAQETIVNYNGNARPGEIVADLTQDPPTLYIGNNLGQLTLLNSGGGSYGNTQVAAYLASGLVGNIIPAGNATYSLGNSTNYWSNLWVAGNTLYIGGVPIGVSGNTLTVANNEILTNGINGSSASVLAETTPSFDTSSGFSSAAWTNAGGGQGAITFSGAVGGLETVLFNVESYYQPTVLINGTTTANIVSATAGRNDVLIIDQVPGTDPTAVTSVVFNLPMGLVLDPTGSSAGLAAGNIGNVIITVGSDSGNTHVWQFSKNAGRTTFPGDIIANTVVSPRTQDGSAFNSSDLNLYALSGGGTDGDGGNVNIYAGGPVGNAVNGGAVIIGAINTNNIYMGGGPGYAAAVDTTFAGNVITAGNVSATGNLTAGNIGVSERITSQSLVTDPVNLGSLTAVFGARAFILDGNLAAAGNFGVQVSGGGSNAVPVWSDGANWYIG